MRRARPSRPLPDFLKLALLLAPVWLATVAHHYFTQDFSGKHASFVQVLQAHSTLYIAMVMLAPLALWVARSCPLDAEDWPLQVGKHAGALFIFGSLDYLLERSLFLLLRPNGASSPALSRLNFHSDSLEGLLAAVSLAAPYYILIVAAHYALGYRHDLHARALKSAQLEAESSQSKLQILKSQLQPHFLFNALNAIYSYIPAEGETARRMVLLLSTFLRRSLQEIALQTVPLRQEVEFVNLYLEIQQLRFSNRLNVAWELDPESLDIEVPHLLLQPLVENAVKHGIAQKTGPGTIWVRAHHAGSFLYLSVEDDGPGLASLRRDEEGAGVGLANTRKRLRHLYGDAALLECGAREGGGFQARLQLPLRRQEDL